MNEKSNLQINTSIIISSIVNFIVPLVCLLVCLVLGFFIIYPYYKNKPTVEAEISSKQNLSGVLANKIVLLNRLSDFKDLLDENSQIVDKVLVSEAAVPQLLDEVYQIATNAGIEVTRLSYSFGGASADVGEVEGFKEVNVSLGGNGSYDQLITILRDMETAARIVYAPVLRYSATEEDLSMSFTINSPYLSVQSTAQTDIPVSLDISNQSFVDTINQLKGLKYYEFLNKDIVVIEETAEATPSANTAL